MREPWLEAPAMGPPTEWCPNSLMSKRRGPVVEVEPCPHSCAARVPGHKRSWVTRRARKSFSGLTPTDGVVRKLWRRRRWDWRLISSLQTIVLSFSLSDGPDNFISTRFTPKNQLYDIVFDPFNPEDVYSWNETSSIQQWLKIGLLKCGREYCNVLPLVHE